MSNIYAVVLAGGSGTRFWPRSRENFPKQLLKITSDKSMIQEIIDRISEIIPKDKIFVSLSERLYKIFKDKVACDNYIVEPLARNNAAAVGLSALKIFEKDPNAIIFFETSDHIYNDKEAYFEHLKIAFEIAEQGKIVQIGIKPTSPHTGYGYIKQGRLCFEKNGIKAFETDSFREKPSRDTAEQYIKAGDYLWNSGIYISKCFVMLEEIKKHMPRLYSALEKISRNNFDSETSKKEFEKLESISIDYGIAEKTKNSVVLRGDFHWDDVGDWLALDRIKKRDSNGNILDGDVSSVDTKDCIVQGKNRLIATIGLRDMIIVDDEDCILVCKKEDSLRLKELIEELKKKHKGVL